MRWKISYYSSSIWKIEEKTTDCASWHRFSKTKIDTAHYPQLVTILPKTDSWWQSALGQLPEESQSQYPPKKDLFTQVSCHDLFVRSVEKTNNHKTAKFVYPDPKFVNTRGFPIDISCCGGSISTEVKYKTMLLAWSTVQFLGVSNTL